MTTVKLPPPVVVRGGQTSRAVRPFASTLRGATIPLPAAPTGVGQPAAAHGGKSALVAPPKAPLPTGREATAPALADPRTQGATAQRPDSPLFRYEALRAYRMGARLATPLRVVPLSTRLILSTLGAALLAALVVATFGQVDLTAHGRGVIRASEGVQPLIFEIDGIVRELNVRDGDVVRAGQVVARLDSTRLSAALREAEEQLGATSDRQRQDDAQAEESYARERTLLERRRLLTRARMGSQERSMRALEREYARYTSLARDGLVSDKVRRESEETLHQHQRELLSLQDEIARIAQQQSTLEKAHRDGITQRAHELRDATTRRDGAAQLLQQTELRAARDGRIESLSVGAGDVVAANRVMARLVPLLTGRRITAFAPERERAFVRPGAAVRVELDQLPVGEFGSASARVVRVSSEVASEAEIARTLGAAAPEGVHFAITLELLDDANTRTLLGRVGSGTLLTVRMPVRRRHIITLLFDPVRRWLD